MSVEGSGSHGKKKRSKGSVSDDFLNSKSKDSKAKVLKGEDLDLPDDLKDLLLDDSVF